MAAIEECKPFPPQVIASSHSNTNDLEHVVSDSVAPNNSLTLVILHGRMSATMHHPGTPSIFV